MNKKILFSILKTARPYLGIEKDTYLATVAKLELLYFSSVLAFTGFVYTPEGKGQNPPAIDLPSYSYHP